MVNWSIRLKRKISKGYTAMRLSLYLRDAFASYPDKYIGVTNKKTIKDTSF